MLTFSILDQKYRFWANLVQNIKIASLSWNFVLRLIWIWTIQWWCLHFPFLTRVIFFFLGGGVMLVKKIKISSLNWTLAHRSIRIGRIPWQCSFSLLYFFGQFGLKNQNRQLALSSNLVLRLIEIWRIQWSCLLFLF